MKRGQRPKISETINLAYINIDALAILLRSLAGPHVRLARSCRCGAGGVTLPGGYASRLELQVLRGVRATGHD